VDRAVRIHRKLRMLDLDQDITPERLEQMPSGVMLVDRAARVLYANAWASALIDSGCGLALQSGCLRSTDGLDALQGLIASCERNFRAPKGPGGEMVIRPSSRQWLRVTVMPLWARGDVAELPWLGVRLPVAMITVSNPAAEKWLT
jgi:hypothetical protein